jgi:hypothetical protein
MIWVYIWILVKAYLELGLFIASLITIITLINNTIDRNWFRDFVFTLFLHPVVVYYLIKELENGE